MCRRLLWYSVRIALMLLYIFPTRNIFVLGYVIADYRSAISTSDAITLILRIHTTMILGTIQQVTDSRYFRVASSPFPYPRDFSQLQISADMGIYWRAVCSYLRLSLLS